MTRTILTLAAAFAIGIAPLTTSAEAGGCGGGYRGYSSYSSYGRSYAKSYSSRGDAQRSARPAAVGNRAKPAVVAVAAAKPSRSAVAEVAEKARDESVEETLSVAAPAPVKVAEEAKASVSPAKQIVASAVAVADNIAEKREIGCKRFVPAAGLTISVKCTE